MKKQINECSCGCGGDRDNGHYMFMSNLKTMRIQMDPQQVEQLLNNGHDWAADHIATSKDDIEEVAGFLSNEMHHGSEMDSYNMQQPQFVPIDFKNHLKKLMPERIEKTESGYFATTETGRRLSKQAKSKKAALAQLAAVEISKHKK